MRDSGFKHKPVMAVEITEALILKAGGRYVDGTVGAGGHAAEILERSGPDGWLYGCDRDESAVEAARARLVPFNGRFEIRYGNYAELNDWVPQGSCDGALLDLGVSSPQLDRAQRGFSFLQDGPLDMRMDRGQRLTAEELVNELDATRLANLFWNFGQERESRRLARAIEKARSVARITTTGQLASLVERENPRRGQKTHPATRVFQALRMAVNDELGLLERGLSSVWSLLRRGGRLAVITFHSLEDRMVKEFGRRLERDYQVPDGGVDIPELRQAREPELRWLSRKATQPAQAEVAANPRARSAQLRVMEKLK